MSASSYTRGHNYTPKFTASVLACLEAYGCPIVNGGRVLDLEINKVRQYAAMSRIDIDFPATRVAVSRTAILEAATEMGTPLILKPNRGGKGLGVQLFNDLPTLQAYLENELFNAGRDGRVLLQQYVKSADNSIIRNEFVGGKFLYTVHVDTNQGFELCSSEACRIDESVEERPMFEILDRFTHEYHAKYERSLAGNGIDIAGIEMIIDDDGKAWTYDVNTNTNYNPEAEAASRRTGTARSGPGAVANFLDRELFRVANPTLAAAE
jgi:biotin carboxylase